VESSPCGLPVGCCRFSTVNAKTRGKHCPVPNRPCLHGISPKELRRGETIQGEWGIWSPRGRPAGAASFLLVGQCRPRLSEKPTIQSLFKSANIRPVCCAEIAMSALPLKADIRLSFDDVRYGPTADIMKVSTSPARNCSAATVARFRTPLGHPSGSPLCAGWLELR